MYVPRLLIYSLAFWFVPQEGDDGSDFLLKDDGDDLDLRLARLEALTARRPELLSSVMLRQNPHNVAEWHKRVKLFANDPRRQVGVPGHVLCVLPGARCLALGLPAGQQACFLVSLLSAAGLCAAGAQQLGLHPLSYHLASRHIDHGQPCCSLQIDTYTQAVKTVDIQKALGKPHSLWVAFAKFYERHGDLPNARIIFEKAVQVGVSCSGASGGSHSVCTAAVWPTCLLCTSVYCPMWCVLMCKGCAAFCLCHSMIRSEILSTNIPVPCNYPGALQPDAFPQLQLTVGTPDLSCRPATPPPPTQVPYKYVDDLAIVWCEWAEMELRHNNFKTALSLMRRATTVPQRPHKLSQEEERQLPVQERLYRWARALC